MSFHSGSFGAAGQMSANIVGVGVNLFFFPAFQCCAVLINNMKYIKDFHQRVALIDEV